MIATLAFTVMLAGAGAGWRAVAGDRVMAADLAGEFEAFSSLPADTEIVLAPAPGARRIFSPSEIARLAGRFGVTLEMPRSACFERQLKPLDPEKVRAALEESLAGRNARLELIDYLRLPVPEGPLEFPRFGLSRQAGRSAALWRGKVEYGTGRSYPIWARVRVSVERASVVASRPLTAGKPIDADSIEIRQAEGFLFDEPAPATIAEVAGRLPRRLIPAGQVIETRHLVSPREVEAGSTVQVQARSGAARLSFEARAESPGRTGDTVLVRNPATGKRFRAVVEAKGRVAVEEAAKPDVQIPPMERAVGGTGGDRDGSQEER